MTTAEMKTHLDAHIDEIRAEYKIDWLAYILNYSSEQKYFVDCDVYIAIYEGLLSKRIYISEDIPEHMLLDAFKIHVKHILSEVRHI